MSFGQANSPSTFSTFMNNIFKDLIVQDEVTMYLDNILILFTDLDEHCHVIKEVLQHLQEHDLFCKLEKCKLGPSSQRVRLRWIW